MFEEYKELFYTVSAFDSGCRMNNAEKQLFTRLNHLHSMMTGYNVTYSVCNRYSLLVKVKHTINEQDNKQTK